MILLSISTTVGAANFVVTVFRTRAPGMSINRLPIIIWGTLTVSVGNLLRRARGEPRLRAAVDGPQSRHAFLHDRHRRPAAAVAAPVLDVRPSLGLCRRAAGHGHGVGRAAGLLPPAAGRLCGGGAVHRAHHGAGLRRVAAPHVRDRAAVPRALVLQRRIPRHHHPECGRGLRLDRHDLDGAARSSPPASSTSPASSSSSPSAASRAS